MKQTLFIGSTVADITIFLPQLPGTGQDVNISGQSMSLGGCAYNASGPARSLGLPYILFSPAGTGIYGDYVRRQLAQRQIPLPIPPCGEENGCCYCFVEESGERTFAALHGAEYRFKREWFGLLKPASIDRAYVCGLELEEETGDVILEFLESHREFSVYFAPGPRICSIPQQRMKRIMALSPVLHLNEDEALRFAEVCEATDGRAADRPVFRAACLLHHLTGSHVIVTRGPAGAVVVNRDGRQCSIPAPKAHQVDTTGAGDCHIGTVIACEMLGFPLEEAVARANRAAAATVETVGTELTGEAFARLNLRQKDPLLPLL